MTQDNGLDAQLPISKEGLLAAIETAIDVIKHKEYDFALEYLARLRDNIDQDMSSYYPPVARKRFKHDGTII